MKKQIFYIAKWITALVAVVFVLGGMFGFIDMSFLLTPEGMALALGAPAAAASQEVVTTQVTKDKSAELLVNNVAKNITRMHPDKYPFDTILREMGIIIPVKSWRSDYYEVETRMLEDTVKVTLIATGTTAAAWTTFDLEVTNMHMWNVDDNVYVQGVNGADSKELVLHICALTATKLTCIALNGIGDNGADVPELAAGVKLSRVGNAKEETASQTTPYSVMPQKTYNYMQIHMAQVEQSLYDKLHTKEVNWDLEEFRSEALWDMRSQMEMASLVGYRAYAYDPVAKKWKYFSGGAKRYITNVISKAATGFSDDDFVDIAKQAFTGNNGSETRVIFAGSGMRATWGKAPTVNKQMTQRDVEVVWGVKFNRIETDFGTFLVKHHPLLNYLGMTNQGFMLDMNNVEKHQMKAMETNSVDFNQSAQRKTNADIIDETFCCAFKNPDTHAIIKLT